MTDNLTSPELVSDFCDFIREAGNQENQVSICGKQSKLRFTGGPEQRVLSTQNYSGIIEHAASDFTITAKSGTPIKDLVTQLRQAGQYLPFDPVLSQRGATVGGTISTGLNGACRLRFGGMRDFLIGCQVVDGNGVAFRSGGKVVKNAAGFDIPKFMIGSAGRFGLITEATFKVFPRPTTTQSAIFETHAIDVAVKLVSWLIHSSLDFDAVEILENCQVIVRWSGSTPQTMESQFESLKHLANRKCSRLRGKEEIQFWDDLNEFKILNAETRQTIAKVATTRSQIEAVDRLLDSSKLTRRYSGAGNSAIVSMHDESKVEVLSEILNELNLSGQVITGSQENWLVGKVPQLPFLNRVKKALDPMNKFFAIHSEHRVIKNS